MVGAGREVGMDSLKRMGLRVARIAMGLIFLGTGLLKLSNLQGFVDSLMGFGIFPDGWIPLLTLMVPLLEVGCGVLLIIGRGTGVGLLAGMMLLLGFSGVLVLARIQGIVVDCGCFGTLDILNWGFWPSLARNVVLIAILTGLYAVHLGERVAGYEE